MKRFQNIFTGEKVTQTGVYMPGITKNISYRKDNYIEIPVEINHGVVVRVTRKRNFIKPDYVFFNTHIRIN